MDQQPPVAQNQTQNNQLPSTPKLKPFRRWLILGSAGMIVLVPVIFAILATHRKPTTSQPIITRTAQILVNKDGFEPATLQVAANTQVTWSNNDSQPHQVAADPYPKNNSIPNFDSVVVLQKGDTYSYNFSKTGTYTYHDERSPLSFKGTVVVK